MNIYFNENHFHRFNQSMCVFFDVPYVEMQYVEEEHTIIPEKNNISGVQNPFYGKKHSEETKQSIREKNKKWKPNKEQLRKLSLSNRGCKNPMYGKNHTEETKKIISEKRKGKPFKGVFSEKGKKTLSEKMKKQFEKNRTHFYVCPKGQIFKLRKEAAAKYGVSPPTITNWCSDLNSGWKKMPIEE